MSRCGDPLKFFLQFFQLEIGEAFHLDQFGAGVLHGANQFVEFELHHLRVAILSVLDEEDDEERADGCSGVDDQLPGIGVVEVGAGGGLYHDTGTTEIYARCLPDSLPI